MQPGKLTFSMTDSRSFMYVQPPNILSTCPYLALLGVSRRTLCRQAGGSWQLAVGGRQLAVGVFAFCTCTHAMGHGVMMHPGMVLSSMHAR